MKKRTIPLILSMLLSVTAVHSHAEEMANPLKMGAPAAQTTSEKGEINAADQNAESTSKGTIKGTTGANQEKKRAGVDVRKSEILPMPPMPSEFDEALKDNFPLTPNQIRQLRRALDESQRAKAETPSTPPKPVTTTMLIKSDPGATPPVARLGIGFVTSIVFVDSSGAPWPVSSVSVGDPNKFSVEQAGKGEEGTNVLTITPQSSYMNSNLVVMLKGRNTPVMITFVSGQKEVDYRIDASVDGRGPNASAPVMTSDIKLMNNPLIQEILDGITPKKGRELRVKGADARAYSINGKIYLRTRASILSPAWSAHISSADGMHVYEIPEVPVILALQDGRQIQLNIEGITWQNK